MFDDAKKYRTSDNCKFTHRGLTMQITGIVMQCSMIELFWKNTFFAKTARFSSHTLQSQRPLALEIRTMHPECVYLVEYEP